MIGNKFGKISFGRKDMFMFSSRPRLGKHNDMPDSAFDPVELAMGIKEEREHTDDLMTAKNIAKDHLTESKNYYSRLKAAGL